MKRFLEVSPPGLSPYPVFIGGEAEESAGARLRQVWKPEWRTAVVIADDTTGPLFGDEIAEALARIDGGPAVTTFRFAPGEHRKTRDTKAAIEDHMLTSGADRSACIVAVGGGVVLDIAGFVAATFMRGIPHINIATSLLAQVDAAIGGKTAINTPHGKNLIGAIHHPRAVLIDTQALTHLPEAELRCGLAEAVKHAVLSDAQLFEQLMQWADSKPTTLRPPTAILERCIEIKAEVVAADDRDRGKRNILNFGHTAAHAIEHATNHQIRHGFAVAMGIVIETRLAVHAGEFPPDELDRLTMLLERLGLPVTPPCSFEHAAAYFSRDKKTVAGDIRCAIPQRIGTTVSQQGAWTRLVSAEQLDKAWLP